MKYTLLERDRVKYISLVLLNEIIQFQHYFPVNLTGDDVYLEPYLQGMNEKGLLRIEGSKYVPTEAGREEIVVLYNKYYEFLKFFDIFCAVDLEQGEFAFASINNDGTDEQWAEFLNDARFSDVRVAVADFKGLNPLEIVFMSFLNEDRFDCTTERWQYNLTGQEVWTEIVDICNSAVSLDYLKEEGVIENIVTAGTELAMQLIKDAEESEQQEEEEYEVVEEVTEEVTEEYEEYVPVVSMPYYPYSYWDPYYDPYYVSPIWLAAAVVIW